MKGEYMKLSSEEKEKILNGEIAILEAITEDGVEFETLDKQEFRDFIGHQENFAIMDDCITLLNGNQINYSGELFRLIHGQKLVVDILEMYTEFFIDSVKESIEEIWD